MTDLDLAVVDATSMAQALRQVGKDIYGNIHLEMLSDEEATRDGIGAALARIASSAKPQDTFVFYASGHGKTIDGNFVFVPYDGEVAFSGNQAGDLTISGGVEWADWQTWLSQIAALKSVWLLDSCESGSAVEGYKPFGTLTQTTSTDRLSRATGRTIFTASSATAAAIEGYRGHGAFTYLVLEALGEADTGNSMIEMSEMVSYVTNRLPTITERTFGLRQVPTVSMSGQDFIIGAKTDLLDEEPEKLMTR